MKERFYGDFMKRQIRRGVFETNSSSMHSLVVKKVSEYFTEQEVRDSMYVNDEGMIHIYHDDMYYGRSPFQVLTSVKDKAFYTLASMCKHKNDAVYNIVCATIRSYIPEFKDFDLSFRAETHDKKYYTKEAMNEWFGKDNYVEVGDQYVCWGYDVGSVDEDILTGFLNKEGIGIAEFLKNKRYIVIVDGDEYCIYKDMKRCGLINKNEIEKEYTPGDWMGEENEEENK